MTQALPSLDIAQQTLLTSLVPDASVRRVAWSGGTTQVVEAGRGTPVVFVHGGFGQATEWFPLWPQLVERYRLLAFDRPGHGLADPFDYADVSTTDLASTFLAEMLDVLELERAVVVGNSMGGRWAIELALREPRRIERLILVGAPAGSCARLPAPLLAMRWPITRSIMRHVFRSATVARVRDFFGSVLVANAGRLSEDFLVAVAAGQRRNYASMLSFARRVIAYRSIHRSMLLDDAWRRLEVPVHFVWGDADAFDAPSAGEAAIRELSAGDMTVIRDAGHLAWLDDSVAVARAIEAALRGPRDTSCAGRTFEEVR
jgi:pimeloyl-ACP methyl ester carboxylesterase